VFNLQPGQGLGKTTASAILAWGLGIVEKIVERVRRPRRHFEEPAIAIQIRQEDEEILMIIREFLFLEAA